ncbi:uncharacterized protein HD556DRAFT_661981 [Suillus plorans]|uniref:Uncharacterized protein n=1 Tax=Suillus plorans TaxID=116603 RepID=A0A9P7DF78_9AGAM|nr:uncharacterized protein HD556DRAFT_661981 [Suillus plorans]KAG1791035.1 hypothetical protein HD556DRAFT_661981 [Suillus plorans]
MGSASSSLPQAPGRVAKVRERCKAKNTKICSGKIYSDPLFKPVLNEYGQPKVIGPDSYRKHTRSVDPKLNRFKDTQDLEQRELRIPTLMIDASHHFVLIRYTRRDSYKRHSQPSTVHTCSGTGERSTAVGALASYPTSPTQARRRRGGR